MSIHRVCACANGKVGHVCCCVCVCAYFACLLCSIWCLIKIFHVPFAGGSVGYVFGGVIGGIVFISCIVGITVLRICLRVASIRRRSENVEAARANPTSAGIGRRVLIIQRVRRVPPTNPDAPPPYVPSADVQSSDPPPYTTDPNNCPQPTSAEDTPTPQPLPPESAPPIPTDEDPPEYLPPPGSNLERQPLLVEEQ